MGPQVQIGPSAFNAFTKKSDSITSQAHTDNSSIFQQSQSSGNDDVKAKEEKKKAEQKKKAENEKKAKQEKEKSELENLSLEDLDKKQSSVSPNLKDHVKKLMEKKEKEAKEKKCKDGNCNDANGGNGKICQSKGGKGGGGKTDGQEQGNDATLRSAHEAAAKNCEKISQEKGDKVDCCKKGIANSWKELAKHIKENATKAVWKTFSGGVLATCSSTGKTCYNPKLKNQQLELEKTIVHENVHHVEFKKTGNSDEKDSYTTEKEYAQKLGKGGGKAGGKGR